MDESLEQPVIRSMIRKQEQRKVKGAAKSTYSQTKGPSGDE